ncbi:hypothetical protein BJ875DRAFT_484893 [Amylocarpus encephaloides]|uniref:Thioredoxin domain-containing protein n=1 Tax=Amylocarpus encephaloides TaxID=45428 RepID=A0A9P8C4M7_9HELO|nr:hypothetical protein BJ875DRAFT_484893 [Amylocarpus encephaloides]
MVIRPTSRILRATRLLRASIAPRCQLAIPIARSFSATKDWKGRNRIYDSVRRPDDFQSYLLLSSSSKTPLITLWTASYCSTCQTILPLLNELVSSGVGEDEGGVAFCEVEYDANDILTSDLGMRYMITSMPTLFSFDRGEAQTQTRVTDPRKMKDPEFMRAWIRTEARRRGTGGGGSATGFLGGLFGLPK